MFCLFLETETENDSPFSWPDLDLETLTQDGFSAQLDLITQPVSNKHTEAHNAIIEARDREFQVTV